MNGKKIILLGALFFAFPLFLFAQESVFSRNLSLGMKGEDVRALQVILNTDKDTMVATIGAGAQGSETDYFGAATKRALAKFQEKYKQDILVPSGLSAGNGYFGPLTRKKILSFTTQKQIADATNTAIFANTPKIQIPEGKIYVMFPSLYSGKPGTVITLGGLGFTEKDNTIYFGANHAVVNASSVAGQAITFKVPNIPKGVYSLFVKNSRGESNKDQWFIVTDGVTPGPKIDKIVPPAPSRGDTVTIYGSGFLAEKNTIMASGIGLFEKVSSSDGVSLSFVVPKTAFPVKFSTSVVNPTVSLPIRVVNENGLSNLGKIEIKL